MAYLMSGLGLIMLTWHSMMNDPGSEAEIIQQVHYTLIQIKWMTLILLGEIWLSRSKKREERSKQRVRE